MGNQILPSPTFLTYSLGCRTNQAEIIDVGNQLICAGFVFFDPKKHLSPDLIVINTCAVTIKAEKESRKTIRYFKKLYPKAKVICLGCASEFIKEADLVIENKNKKKFLSILFSKFPHFKLYNKSNDKVILSYISSRGKLESSARFFLKIQEGCNQFCSYCIVPFLRGVPKSEPPEAIISKILKLEKAGIKEVILCGTNLSLYGQDIKKPQLNLTSLVKKILKKTKIERISLSSIEPEFLYTNDEFIEICLKEPRLAKYIHLSLQSGSKKILKEMGRKTDLEKLLKILRFIKEKHPEFTFRADLIVGFPTETEENFQETITFIKKVSIPFVHVFPYSVRPGTKAEKMIKDKIWKDLPTEAKKERLKKIVNLTKEIQNEEGKKMVEKILPCLLIKENEAIANNSWPVRINNQPLVISKQSKKGKIFPVKITNSAGNYLRGEIFSLQI